MPANPENFAWPAQADATAQTPPPEAGEPVSSSGVPSADQLGAQIDATIAEVHRAMAHLSTVGPAAIEAEKRRGLLEQYDSLEVYAADLAQRFDPQMLAEEGYRLGLSADVEQFQADARLFVNAIEETAGTLPVVAETAPQAPAAKRPKVMWWVFGGATAAVVAWGIYRFGRGPMRAR